MSPDKKLIYLANQIGKVFAPEPESQAIGGIGAHLKKFWEPRMRRLIVDHRDAGGEDLDPRVRNAVEQLREPLVPTP